MRPSLADLVSTMTQDDGLGRPVDADEARDRADDILSRAEYQEPDESIVDRVLEWIGEQLGRLFLDGAGGGARNVIAYLLVIGVVGLVVWVVVKSMRVPGGATVTAGADVTYGTESWQNPSVWQAEADRLAAAGDFRGALRCRHQALIATWIADGVIDHVVGRTAAECHVAAVDVAGLDADRSRRVVDRFDAVWYGARPVDAGDYQTFADDCARLATARSGSRRVGAPM